MCGRPSATTLEEDETSAARGPSPGCTRSHPGPCAAGLAIMGEIPGAERSSRLWMSGGSRAPLGDEPRGPPVMPSQETASAPRTASAQPLGVQHDTERCVADPSRDEERQGGPAKRRLGEPGPRPRGGPGRPAAHRDGRDGFRRALRRLAQRRRPRPRGCAQIERAGQGNLRRPVDRWRDDPIRGQRPPGTGSAAGASWPVGRAGAWPDRKERHATGAPRKAPAGGAVEPLAWSISDAIG